MPSNRSACMTVSTESAITSRLTSEARMPSCPMEMPSDTAMVTNSRGNPPASRTPALASWARRPRGRLHGVTSFHEEATPIWGLSQSSSPMPTARSMARAGARVGPSVTAKLRGLMPTRGCSEGSPAGVLSLIPPIVRRTGGPAGRRIGRTDRTPACLRTRDDRGPEPPVVRVRQDCEVITPGSRAACTSVMPTIEPFSVMPAMSP